MKYLLPGSLIILLSACAGDFTFKSNLDSDAINDYFKASDVTVYEGNVQPTGSYEIKGLVEGESCQIATSDVPASIAEARTLARRAAADKQANGIVVKSCLIIDEPTTNCISRAICVGQAIVSTNQLP
ncbi:Rcs stress response system protein RcsF [Shewanella youngdeokensis]|uniref:Rcs stress response system protein RcsF n=1 Tax=Shewanella youngdeokensis TaxID=2999068 RepID=A0ABZ0JX96_9GAMM|nr:Rcs stress response system protein RcsF [Shewanella sp. DAU334]